jgi:hypothetical protein
LVIRRRAAFLARFFQFRTHRERPGSGDKCTEFLAWWGIWLYLAQLGSRRQLDFELRDGGPRVLANINRLAETKQISLPVHDTLDHFLGHVPLSAWEAFRFRKVQRLVRIKVFEAARLQGRLVPYWPRPTIAGVGVHTVDRPPPKGALEVASREADTTT